MRVRVPRRRRVIWGSVLSLFCLMLGVDANQTVPSSGIVGHWPFDSFTTTTPDVSTFNNTATLLNTPTSAAGLFGNALHFTAASSEYGKVNHAASLDITTGFTVGVWVKPTGTGIMRVLNKWDNTKGWHLDINAGVGGAAVAGNIRLRVKDAVGNDSDYFAPGGIVAGSWNHIAGVYDFTADTAKLYVNGVQKGATKNIVSISGSINNTAVLGIAALAGAPTLTPYYNGDMDEPVVYTRALSATEIQSMAGIPQGLTASTTQIGQVTLNWTAVGGAANYSVMRSSVSGGPYTFVNYAPGASTTYVDASATAGTYYYVLRANFSTGGGFTSSDSNQATGTSLPPVVTALPNSGLFTNEAGATTTFDITINRAIPSATTVNFTVTCSDATEGNVKDATHAYAASIPISVTGPQAIGYTIPITVKGMPDLIADGPQPYTVTVTTSSTDTTFDKLAIPPVQLTNNDDDVAGITFSTTTGLTTTESGGTATLTVSLNTQPVGLIDLVLTSSNTAEGTVSPTLITFNSTNWNTPQLITLTGVDDTILDFAVPYSIFTSLATHHPGDAAYNTVTPPILSAVNLDNEVIPEPPHAWGGTSGGGGGGCGLTGLDSIAALALAALLRRRRR